MTWPMHDAGPTTPDPGGDDPQGVPPRRDEPRRNRRWPDPPWNEPPRPEEPEGAEADRTMQLSPGPGLGRGKSANIRQVLLKFILGLAFHLFLHRKGMRAISPPSLYNHCHCRRWRIAIRC